MQAPQIYIMHKYKVTHFILTLSKCVVCMILVQYACVCACVAVTVAAASLIHFFVLLSLACIQNTLGSMLPNNFHLIVIEMKSFRKCNHNMSHCFAWNKCEISDNDDDDGGGYSDNDNRHFSNWFAFLLVVQFYEAVV